MVTKEEAAKIRAKAKAAGLTISEYLRKVALGG
jgi:mobilization protein NikA